MSYSDRLVVFGQKWLYSGKSGSIRAIRLYSVKNGCIRGKSGCIRTKVVVFEQKRFYSGKSGCIRAKVIVFGQS